MGEIFSLILAVGRGGREGVRKPYVDPCVFQSLWGQAVGLVVGITSPFWPLDQPPAWAGMGSTGGLGIGGASGDDGGVSRRTPGLSHILWGGWGGLSPGAVRIPFSGYLE